MRRRVLETANAMGYDVIVCTQSSKLLPRAINEFGVDGLVWVAIDHSISEILSQTDLPSRVKQKEPGHMARLPTARSVNRNLCLAGFVPCLFGQLLHHQALFPAVADFLALQVGNGIARWSQFAAELEDIAGAGAL